MKTAKEFIVHPDPAEIRSLPPEGVVPYLRALWARNAESPSADFDRLYGSGQLARQLQISGVEQALSAWLLQTSGAARWDVAASFLSGYWVSLEAPSEALVSSLLGGLSALPPGVSADSLVTAIGASAEKIRSKTLRDQVQRVFRSLHTTPRPTPLQPATLATVSFVLDKVLTGGVAAPR